MRTHTKSKSNMVCGEGPWVIIMWIELIEHIYSWVLLPTLECACLMMAIMSLWTTHRWSISSLVPQIPSNHAKIWSITLLCCFHNNVPSICTVLELCCFHTMYSNYVKLPLLVPCRLWWLQCIVVHLEFRLLLRHQLLVRNGCPRFVLFPFVVWLWIEFEEGNVKSTP